MNTLKKKMLAQAVPLLVLVAATSVKVVLSAKDLWDTAKEERIKKAASSAEGVHESAGGQQKDSE